MKCYLGYNEEMNVIFNDGDILTASSQGAFNGLGGVVYPKTEDDKKRIERLAALKTYSEIKGNRNRYARYMAQFKSV